MNRLSRILPIVLILLIVILSAEQQKRHTGLHGEACLFCHERTTDPDPSHPVGAFGCSVCHLGNPFSFDSERAHATMVRNPGDLRRIGQTCGKTGCHPEVADRVEKSVMATNRGILKTVQAHWLNLSQETTEVRDLLTRDPPHNLAIDQYRKMCGGCHLWKEREEGEHEVALRGGGCSDCHVPDTVRRERLREDGSLQHPRLTTRIPSENCVKCHNRSARIGLSYFGKYESAGYGTPYQGRELSWRRLSGRRFFLHLPADAHFAKAQLTCIDCHTSTGLMGDGLRHDDMDGQLDVTCEACHLPRWQEGGGPGGLVERLVSMNRRVPKPAGDAVALTKKQTPIYNLQRHEGNPVFFRKQDGRAIVMNPQTQDRFYHRFPGHERLSCQACHSAWIPQCYGCHITYQASGVQTDWLSGKESGGRWEERRSYIRFSKPALGLKGGKRIAPLSPCQVFLSYLDPSGAFQEARSFQTLTVSAFDPHTTQKAVPSCAECHSDPKTLGFGEGELFYRNGEWSFRPTYDTAASGLGLVFPLDGYVDVKGEVFQTNVYDGTRPFAKEEIARILGASPCIVCHDRYEDPIYLDFHASRRRFDAGEDLPCLR